MKILYIEACNYVDFPVGGQLTFARQMIQAFGNELQLVGISTDKTLNGKWVKKEINGTVFNFFSLHKANKINGKPFIPRRLSTYYYLKKYKKQILTQDCDHIFCNAPETLIAIQNWRIENLTYYFSGMGNPLTISRRWYGRLVASLFDPVFYPALKNANNILAASDQENIDKTIKASNGILIPGEIIQFPSRIDTKIFKNEDKFSCRKELNLPTDKTIITTTGRLHWAKGWKLILDAFREFRKFYPDSVFYFIGDGDERAEIELYLKDEKLSHNVFLLGFQSHQTIAKYINSSDLYIMGSIAEGWATSLVEAKGCGVPICTTTFSSAKDIVQHGKNGYVVNSRDEKEFAEYMMKAIKLKIDDSLLEKEMQKYAIQSIKSDLKAHWKLVNRSESYANTLVLEKWR